MTLTMSVKLGRKGQFVTPKEMRDALAVKEGEELLITQEGARAALTKQGEYARRTRSLLKGTWGKDKRAVEPCLEKERRSWD